MIVKEKIKLTDPILPSFKLTDEEVSVTLNRWIKLLTDHQIHVVFNQTPVKCREQYDYLANEFMLMELPPHPEGLHFCFMYDPIQPEDEWSDIDKMVHQMLEDVFRKKQPSALPYVNRRLHFNEFENLSEPEFNYLVINHPKYISDVGYFKIELKSREVFQNNMDIKGNYHVGYAHPCHCDLHNGNWKVSLCCMEGKWGVKALFIDGF